MGNYITQTGGTSAAGDLTNKLGNPTLVKLAPDGSGGVSATATESAITEAESLIDGMLGGAYSVPFASPPPSVIKTIALSFAVYFLHSRRPEFTAERGRSPVEHYYTNAMSLLENLQRIRPALVGTSSRSTESVDAPLVSSEDSVWTDD